MFETDAPVGASEMRCWLSRLAGPLGAASRAGDLIDEIAVLERLGSAVAARRARVCVEFDRAQQAAQVEAGVPLSEVGRGVAEQVALARRESPARAAQHLVFAKALVGDMPHTLAALAEGEVGEWTASLVVKETDCLSAADRRAVDVELVGVLGRFGPRRVRQEAWAAACRVDPGLAAARCTKAASERRVDMVPASDGMTKLLALLPVQDGVAVFEALDSAAGTARAAGDGRTRGQVMADTLVQRLTTHSATPNGSPVGVEVHLVMTAETLLRGGDGPALLTSDPTGSNAAADLVPAPMARDLVRDAAAVWVRRLFTAPSTGELVAMESTRRLFAGHLRRVVVLRDQTCRTPFCEAPIRHGDHIRPAAEGGRTSVANGQGLCERCNQVKNLPGWKAEVVTPGGDVDVEGVGRDGPRDDGPGGDDPGGDDPGGDDPGGDDPGSDDPSDDGPGGTGPPGGHVVRTTTPTGHTYESGAPPLLDTGCASATGEPALPVGCAVSERRVPERSLAP